jgi:hypothetical protein
MACSSRKWNVVAWLAVGLLAGVVATLVVVGVWPSTPLHAVATDRSGDFAIATGPVDEMTEAVYFMDFLTGDLRAVVIGKNPAGTAPVVTGIHQANAAMALKVDPSKSPRFLMVTGMNDLARGRAGNVQPSKALVWVAEVTSGRCVGFAIPFNPNLHKQGRMSSAPLYPIVPPFAFRTAAAAGGNGKAKEEEE